MTQKAAVDKNKYKESPLDLVFLALAGFLEQVGKDDTAYSVYEFILKNNPNSVGALVGKGMLDLLNLEDEKAMLNFNKAVARASRDRNALRARAFAHMINGNFEGASKDFQKSFSENQEWDSLSTLLAYCLKQKEENESAKQLLNEALDGKITVQDWPYPILQLLRGDIDMSAVMSIAFSKPRQLETRAYLGFCRCWSKNADEGKADLLFVQNANSGSSLVKLMAERGLKIIEEGHKQMIAKKSERSDKIGGMDLL